MPTLTIVQGPDKGQVLRLSEEHPVLLGRACPETRLTDYSVSRRHAEIRYAPTGWYVEDLKSANGTYLNNRRVERPARLKHGDQIRLGGTLLLWDGRDERAEARSPRTSGARIDLDAGNRRGEAPIIETAVSSDDSVILASPAAAEAVRAWRVLSTLLEAVGAVSSPEQVLERTLDVLFEEMPIDHGFILMRAGETGSFEPRVSRSREETAEKIRANRAVVDYVIEHRAGVLSSNAMVDERFGRAGREPGTGMGLQSVICVPIITPKEISGVIHLDVAISRHIYTEEQLRLASAIGRMTALAVENAQLVADRVRTERLAATGETVTALSHHIKNILQGVMGGSDVVEMGLRQENLATVDQGYQVVRRNLERILSLSMNMLAFSKKREPRSKPVQFNALVAEALELAQHRAEDKAVLLRSDLEDGIPAIPLDHDGINQVLLNLLHNALDAVPKSTGVVTVRTTHNVRRGQVVLTVGDNGPGISDEIREHLFDAFASTKGQGGTGLGLAVARKIVEEHFGSISASSIPNQGTILRVSLPLVQPTGIDSAATHGPAAG